MSLRDLFSRTACGATNPSAPNACTRPNEPNGHDDGMHIDGTGHALRGWIDDRSVHTALGMEDPPVWRSAPAADGGRGAAR